MDSKLQIDETLQNRLSHLDIDPDSVLCVDETDILRDDSYGSEWLVIESDSVHVVPPVGDATTFRISEIDEIKIENLVSGGMLTARRGNESAVLLRFSGAKAKLFGKRLRIIKKLTKGEEVSPADFDAIDVERMCPTCGLAYLDADRKFCPRCTDKKSLFVRTLSYAWKHGGAIASIILTLIVATGLRMISPILSGKILFDDVLDPSGRYYGQIGMVVGLMLLVEFISTVLTVAYNRKNAWLAATIIFELKTQVYSRLQHLSLGFFTRKQTGGLMIRVNGDTEVMQYFFHDGLPYFVMQVVMLIGVISIMCAFHWQMTLLALIPAPIMILLMKRAFPRLWLLFSRRHQKRRKLSGLLNDVLTGFRVVKSFGKEEAEIRRFTPVNQNMATASHASQRYAATLFPLLFLIMQAGGYVVWAFGGWRVIGDTMTFGVLMTFIRYLWMVYRPLGFLTQVVDWWGDTMNAAQRVFEIVDGEPDVRERDNPIHLPRIAGKIEMRDVTFSYEPNNPVLHNVTIEVGEGETIGLVGHTGAGKTTITNLISRLYDPDEGSVLIDSIDVRDLALSDLHGQIGTVLQETFLFTGTVAENIRYAKPEALFSDIVRAAKAAHAHDFILQLPDGYDTRVGYHGHDFSGGERQRLAIARAILHDPRILILDEATSSMDTETEQKIQDAIERLIVGRTTIAIAHRLSTLKHADRLYVVEHGRIVEHGTHEELWKTKGTYHRLVQKQREALKHIGVVE